MCDADTPFPLFPVPVLRTEDSQGSRGNPTVDVTTATGGEHVWGVRSRKGRDPETSHLSTLFSSLLLSFNPLPLSLPPPLGSLPSTPTSYLSMDPVHLSPKPVRVDPGRT